MLLIKGEFAKISAIIIPLVLSPSNPEIKGSPPHLLRFDDSESEFSNERLKPFCASEALKTRFS
jgi:hypothetical protein